MYTLYNDFKYKNTYLRVCIPYIMTLNIRIHIFIVYVYLIFLYNVYLYVFTLYKNTYLHVCIPYIIP